MDSTTLSTSKSSFLLSQIRLLSTPLPPSPTLTTLLTQSHDRANIIFPPKLLTDLLARVNARITQHNKTAFPAQTQRHIVEQIESLYFSAALADDNPEELDVGQGEELIAIERDADLTSSSVLAGLPEELQQAMLHDISDLSIDDEQADEYYNLRQRLILLSTKRDAAREKVHRYRKLQDLLRPFENVQEDVQPNLVTKDGELARELERMRVLLARVQGRMGEVGELPEGEG